MSLPTLYTQRLCLRPFEFGDAAEVQRLAGARKVAEMTANIPHPYPDGAAEEWIANHEAAFSARESITLAIRLRETSALLGAVSLGINTHHAHAELGYWIAIPFWGQGFCTEAASALVEFGFQEMDLHRIYSCHYARNPASGRVMQKLGMAHEGSLHEHVRNGDGWDNMERYGLLAHNWRVARQS